MQHKLTSHRHFSGLNLQSTNLSSKGDIEDQSEEGGEIEAKFFKKLDEELNNVNTFYKDKSEEMKHEAFLLNKQMDALIALRIKVDNPLFDGSDARKSDTTGVASTNPLKSPSRDTTSGVEDMNVEHGVEISNDFQLEKSSYEQSGREHMELTNELDRRTDCNQEESTRGPEVIEVQAKDHGNAHQEKDNLTDYNEDPLKILERVKINNTFKSPLATIKDVFKDSKEEELSFKKEELKKVEERLRVALIEFYQKLLLLKHYSYMNLAAFSKIMKKYEKISSRRASRSYMKTVDNSCLGNSDEVRCFIHLPVVNGLLERVEATFIKHFANSNRREGMDSLRPKAKREKHSVTFFSGKIQARKLMDKVEGASYMVNIFPLYRQVQAIRSIELYICYYGLGEYSRRQNKCHSHGAYNAFYLVVAVVPFWLRLLQFRVSNSQPVTWANSEKKTCCSGVGGIAVAVIVNTYWDIAVDWGLLRRKSKNAFLRDKLVISHKSVYFAAMIMNVVLRLAWMQLVIEFNLHSIHKMAALTTISCLEIIRRGIWSFFRLENEHLNNVGKYRALKSVPLPFTYYDTDADKDD
ncbi:hypothetical protein POTOM_031395 [Populus tomentosa]|uniref:Uncharacterized protein n=1 Tax=Populus tomentosa TaxID=118781 RepID=A0A8X7ZII5_POPTO|nr:hypothetical protein POTOM_031395 [Populus tomentosa]